MIFSALVAAMTVAVSNAQGGVFRNGANKNQIIAKSDFIGAVADEVESGQVIQLEYFGGTYPDGVWKFVNDKTYIDFRLYEPTGGAICNRSLRETSCTVNLAALMGGEWLEYVHISTESCGDSLLIDDAHLHQWTWVKCGFWWGCGFDGGYWKRGPDVDWGLWQGKSWCLSDDANAWKLYSECWSGDPSECRYCGEGYWVPSKSCDTDLEFRKDGNVYARSSSLAAM